MSCNSFGRLLRLTTWGESHGAAIGGVLDGCPAGIPLTEEDLRYDLSRRRPGQSRLTTQRQESDEAKILSGVFDGFTTGTPISFMIENSDHRSSSYEDIKNIYRPGHADYCYDKKYGLRDYRGGGRSSARETAVRVAAGVVAKKILEGITIIGHTTHVAHIKASKYKPDVIENNPVRCADEEAAAEMAEVIDAARLVGDSVGGVIELRVSNVPAGLGMPVYGRLDADIAAAMMGINAVKGVEIGGGFAASMAHGSEFNDEMRMGDDGVQFLSNNAGGIIGGISSGQDIIVRIAIKPTPSILHKQQTINKDGENVDVSVEGRHDPCVVPRAVPVAEAMMALLLADHLLLHRASRIK